MCRDDTNPLLGSKPKASTLDERQATRHTRLKRGNTMLARAYERGRGWGKGGGVAEVGRRREAGLVVVSSMSW